LATYVLMEPNLSFPNSLVKTRLSIAAQPHVDLRLRDNK